MRPLILLALTACTTTNPNPVAVFNPDGGFFDTPWPSDARTTPEGWADWTGFPNPTDITLIGTYTATASLRTGFAMNAPMYVRFAEPIDTRYLPPPEWSTSPASPITLVNVDPRSPEYGLKIPFEWEMMADEGNYHPANELAISPVAGFALAPRTTYALVVSASLAARDTAFDAAWSGDDSAWSTSFAPLKNALPMLRIPDRDVALATVFTTMDAVEPMEHIAKFLEERVEPPTFQADLEWLQDLGGFRVYRSNYTTPNYMDGVKPYANEGGAFRFREDGMPTIQAWEPMRLSVVVPKDQEPPPEGWPVLVSLHGTGGDYRTFCNSSSEFEIGQWMAGMGVVGVSIDLPLHGARGTPDTIIDLHSFNVLQPDSALHIHRQAAADVLYLLHGLVDNGALTFTTPEGTTVPLDTSRLSVIGHSQGGITTALALPWMGSRIDGAMMSGTGGLLAITAVERDSDYDFPEMITSLLDFDEGETLTEKHPVLGLVQSLVEITDPINFARYWYREDGGLTGAQPTSFVITSGLRDDMTPYRTAEALAASAEVPFVGRRYSAAVGNLLKGLDSVELPTAGNVQGWDGSEITGGLSQWDSGTHFVIFEEEGARDIARNFVWSTLFDTPTLFAGEIPPEEVVLP